MKKTLQISIALLLLFSFATGTSYAETRSQTIHLIVGQSTAQINGKDITMAAPAQVISGSTLVPLRFIGEAFGSEVTWDGAKKTAKVVLGSYTIEVPIGQNYVMVNGGQENIAVPGQLINGSTYVPLRFIGESLGAEVNYDADTKGISILMNTYQNKTLGFEVVVPTGWTVSKESSEDVVISKGNYAALIGLVDDSSDITDPYFKGVADGFFTNYATREDFKYSTNYKRLAVGAYKENGITYFIALKWLDNGAIYYCAVANATDSFDVEMSYQSDILVNTLKSYELQ